MKTPSLTAVLHEDFKDAPSGLTGYVIADLLGKPYATIMSELSRQPGHKFGADLVLPLMQKSGSDRGLDFLAREMGGVFVRLPEVRPGLGDAVKHSIKAMREFSQLMQSVSEALADGRVSRQEREEVRRECYESIQANLVLLQFVEAQMEPEGAR